MGGLVTDLARLEGKGKEDRERERHLECTEGIFQKQRGPSKLKELGLSVNQSSEDRLAPPFSGDPGARKKTGARPRLSGRQEPPR